MGNVAVIGGGIIGASIAWQLARSGHDVTVMERGRMGGEASTAGAGMLAPGGEVGTGGEFADLLLESARTYSGWVQELEAESGMAIDYRVCGALDVARSDEDWAELFDRASRQRQMGIAVRTDQDGLFYPDDAIVDPAGLMRAVQEACVRRKVQVREDSPVVSGVLHESRIVLDGESYDAAVLAAGAWSSLIPIAGAIPPASFPVKGHLLGYELPPGSVPHILRHGHTYILQRASGFTVAGASTENAGFDKTADPAIAAEIQHRAERLLPMLEGLKPLVWTGLRPGAAHPAIGRYQDSRLWLAYGHYRNGILAATATAARIAASITATLGKD